MVQTVSDRYDQQLYDTVTKTAAALNDILFTYRECWKFEIEALDIVKKPDTEVLTGIIGERGAGKSTLFNSICCYPILPAASVIASERPIEIRKSAKEYIQVVWTEQEETRNIDFSRVLLEEGFVRNLLEYAILCCRNSIITCDNLNYLTTKPIHISPDTGEMGAEDFDLFDPSDPRQVMMLLMILLGCHVGTFSVSTESDAREEVKAMYRRLMAKIGLDPETEFLIQLFWNSPLLQDGMVLMDLPGLRDTAGRSTVTLQQLHRLDSVILLFSPDQEEPDLYRFVKDLQRYGKQTPAPGSFSRIAMVLNKADLYPDKLEDILSSIRKKCGLPEDFPVYPVCAISGEYLYSAVGGIDHRTAFLYKAAPPQTGEAGETALLERFSSPYQSVTLEQVQKMITGELTGRVRSVTGLLWLNTMTDEFEDLKRSIALQRSFLLCLEKCGTRFTKYFYEALSSACAESLDAFQAEFQSAARRLLDHTLAAEDFQEAADAFRDSLTQMESHILQTAEQYFRRMKRKNFRIHLSDESNQAVFRELSHWLAGSPGPDGTSLLVSDHLQPGNRLLEQALDRQYQIYRNGIDELVQKYLEFPCIFDRAFQAAWENAAKAILSENPTLTKADLETYRDQTRILQETVSTYLTETVHARILLLQSDRTIAEEFARTSRMIRSRQQLLEAFYYKKCPELLDQCLSAALFNDNIYFRLRQARIQFRNSLYAAGAKNDFLKDLDHLLTADPDDTDPSGSLLNWIRRQHRKFQCRTTHPRRIKLAVDELSRQFCAHTGRDLRRFSGQMKKKAKALMNSGKQVHAEDNKRLSGLSAQYQSALVQMRSDLRPVLQKMMTDPRLSEDVSVLLKRLNDL